MAFLYLHKKLVGTQPDKVPGAVRQSGQRLAQLSATNGIRTKSVLWRQIKRRRGEAHRSTSSRFRSTLHRETPRQPHSGETTRRLLWRSTLQRETHDGIDSGRHTLTRRRPTAPDRGSCRRRAARTRPDSCQAVATPRTAASDACLHRSRALTWRAAGLDVLGSCAPVLAGWGAPRTPYPTTCSSAQLLVSTPE